MNSSFNREIVCDIKEAAAKAQLKFQSLELLEKKDLIWRWVEWVLIQICVLGITIVPIYLLLRLEPHRLTQVILIILFISVPCLGISIYWLISLISVTKESNKAIQLIAKAKAYVVLEDAAAAAAAPTINGGGSIAIDIIPNIQQAEEMLIEYGE
ncbi:hypothetical protein OROMI_010197 [Orobanche minor]